MHEKNDSLMGVEISAIHMTPVRAVKMTPPYWMSIQGVKISAIQMTPFGVSKGIFCLSFCHPKRRYQKHLVPREDRSDSLYRVKMALRVGCH